MSKRREWQDEFDVAALVLKSEPGTIEWAADHYVAFRYREASVRIVFYPHRTSAGNYHLRVRDEGSKDKPRFKELARRLYVGSGLSCTFQVKYGIIPDKGDIEYGWAAKEVTGHSSI